MRMYLLMIAAGVTWILVANLAWFGSNVAIEVVMSTWHEDRAAEQRDALNEELSEALD